MVTRKSFVGILIIKLVSKLDKTRLEFLKQTSLLPTYYAGFYPTPVSDILTERKENCRFLAIENTVHNSLIVGPICSVTKAFRQTKQAKKKEVCEELKKKVIVKIIPDWMSSIAILLLAIPLPANAKQSNQHPEESSEYKTLTRNKGKSSMKCELCQLCFRSKVTLTLHQFYKHRRVKTLKVGKKRTQSNTKKIEHLRKHSKAVTSRHSTSVRNKSPIPFVLEEFLKSIGKQNVARNPSEWKYQCGFEGCGKRFMTMSNLNQHKRMHGERRFQCDWEGCKWKFVFRSDLQRHKNGHIGFKPFQCSVCEKEYARSDSLKNHMKTHKSRSP
ncbi:Krueppel-like factor 15 [Orchesella cincta]|uniref:Krueppel-like factor 15 n=1 Tax=Orchesella cincta TaxID=48709 RepID=A0A1D2M679_ORCCI|nr:Krueppel-like factor 15 [Orchesella cincta]